ncbi:hypothetical protein LEM8419_03333 [Neolewinella maritima]|uniref:HTH marR-type domain-containing protein n=1 Tax=Neolewinella maritima TaxID=1383882 RepID=A0ABN8FDL1_9BACT|nr:MarR family transcriptional regulator [Neolewinella maritima]CAH1002454.1 hypothetical protein LEM8419_03333 [Neolewinella maritima]
MIKDIKLRVEEIGKFFESTGLTPVEARTFALLLLSDPPELDFFAIQEFLGASKSTISNALKRLMNEGRVDYTTKPGDRKRYFRVSSQKWLEQIQDSFTTITPFVATMKKVVDLRKDTEDEAFNADLRRIQDYFLHLEQELPRIRAEWEQRRAAAAAAGRSPA